MDAHPSMTAWSHGHQGLYQNPGANNYENDQYMGQHGQQEIMLEPQYMERIVEVPKVQIDHVERLIEVPQQQIVDRVVEIPQIQEVIREIPGDVQIEIVTKEVPKIEVRQVEKIVEVPQIEYEDRYVEVEEVREVVRRIPRVEVREIPIERIIHVPKKIIQEIEQPVYRPVPHLVQQRVEREIPVAKPQIQTLEVVRQVAVPYAGDAEHGHYLGTEVQTPMPHPSAQQYQPDRSQQHAFEQQNYSDERVQQHAMEQPTRQLQQANYLQYQQNYSDYQGQLHAQQVPQVYQIGTPQQTQQLQYATAKPQTMQVQQIASPAQSHMLKMQQTASPVQSQQHLMGQHAQYVGQITQQSQQVLQCQQSQQALQCQQSQHVLQHQQSLVQYAQAVGSGSAQKAVASQNVAAAVPASTYSIRGANPPRSVLTMGPPSCGYSGNALHSLQPLQPASSSFNVAPGTPPTPPSAYRDAALPMEPIVSSMFENAAGSIPLSSAFAPAGSTSYRGDKPVAVVW